MSERFADLPGDMRRRKLERARLEADWAAREGPLGGVILHMRRRALAAKNGARLFFTLLVVTVVSGLAFYLGLPFWQTWADGREEALQETLDGITARKGVLDTKRTALMLGGTLEDGTDAPLLTALLEDTFVALPIVSDTSIIGAAVHRDALYLFGNGGLVLRNSSITTDFELIPAETDAFFTGAVSHLDNLYIFGGGGTIVRIASSGIALESLSTGMDARLDGAISDRNELLFFGDKGAIHRLSADGREVEKIPTGVSAGINGAIKFGGHFYLYGERGTLMRLAPGGSKVDVVNTYSDVSLSGSFTQGDLLFFFGEDGTLFRLSGDGVKIDRIQTDSNASLSKAVNYNGRLYIFGGYGTLLQLAPNGNAVEHILTGTREHLNGAIEHEGLLYLFGSEGGLLSFSGENGKIDPIKSGTKRSILGAKSYGDQLFFFGILGELLRLSTDGTATRILPTGVNGDIIDAIDFGDRIYFYGRKGFVGESGILLTRPDALIASAKALSTVPDESGMAAVEAFFSALPPHIGEMIAIRDLRDRLRLVASERAGLELIERRTLEDLSSLQINLLQYLRERRTLDFEAFLSACRGTATPPDKDLTTACLTAWQTQQSGGETWWKALVDQVPPGILLLFLLATSGGLYRYNVRLAGFHDSRADALQLLSQGRTEAQLKDILATTPGEAVNLASIFLAADKVEMGTIKAKLGQAEIELAKALNAGE